MMLLALTLSKQSHFPTATIVIYKQTFPHWRHLISKEDCAIVLACKWLRSQFSVLHQWRPKLQFALHVFSPAALKYSVALCQQKCKRQGTLESNYCSSNFGEFFSCFSPVLIGLNPWIYKNWILDWQHSGVPIFPSGYSRYCSKNK